MEENVALDSSKQKQFVKSIKKLKLKKTDVKDEVKSKDDQVQKKKEKRSSRGLVYLGHIPHGFYEHEMTQYFKQFGMVTNVRVIRSKRTGNSKGFAFVEFKEPAVAEIVAETMNNYLMGKRLIKAAYIPPEKQKHHAKRKFWSSKFNPSSEARIKMKKAYNADKDEKGDLQKARKLLSNLTRTKKKLSDLGIDYDFFAPVDVPESLQHLLSKPEVKQENEVVKGKLDKKVKKEVKSEDNKSNKKKDKKQQPIQKVIEKSDKRKETIVKVEEKASKNKKSKTGNKVNEKEQTQKEKKLKEAGVKHVENFIKIQESDEDSDSSYAFDSDEFEKMLGNDGDDDAASGDSEGSDEDNAEESESEEELPEPPKKQKNTPKLVPLVKAPKQGKKDNKLPETKRKASQKDAPVSPKKSKFENRNTQKLVKKQFKKKK
ncbi:hypothetical protein ABMA27_001020 [Loxostege sticticalis]|uniref:RRM domain-containing protein n=1 Tax=Loxostege sticticalis TaxID=481309 RepID=A0ABR3I170_LOXSC